MLSQSFDLYLEGVSPVLIFMLNSLNCATMKKIIHHCSASSCSAKCMISITFEQVPSAKHGTTQRRPTIQVIWSLTPCQLAAAHVSKDRGAFIDRVKQPKN
jgi:hypothetical protein